MHEAIHRASFVYQMPILNFISDVGSSIPRLEPFASGLIYNVSRNSRVQVLPAIPSSSSSAVASSTAVAIRTSASPMSHLHLVKLFSFVCCLGHCKLSFYSLEKCSGTSCCVSQLCGFVCCLGHAKISFYY